MIYIHRSHLSISAQISCETFLSAAKLRHARGKARSKALRLMHQLLTKADQAKSVTHLVQDSECFAAKIR